MREFAAKQNAGLRTFIAAEGAKAGMAGLSKLYNETGRGPYMDAGDASTISWSGAVLAVSRLSGIPAYNLQRKTKTSHFHLDENQGQKCEKNFCRRS